VPLLASPGVPAVRASSLSKHYGATVALDNLDLELYPGEVFGFLGPNGAGKTTTAKLLLGLVRPTSGSVEIHGTRLAGNDPRLPARVAAVVEAPAFYPYLSARDNLRVLARLGGVDERRIDEALETVGLMGAERHRFSRYSMGMKQRLALASVFLRDARLIVLDEPTSGLDPQGQREIDALIRRLADEGRTIFLSSHSLPEVEQICDRVAIMNRGAKVFEGVVAELVRGRDQVLLRVHQRDAAAELIRRLPWVGGVAFEGRYLVVDVPADRAGNIAAELSRAGVFPDEIRPRLRTIENLYHSVIGQAAA
jgi:ABC-2 type transport system ATP-binding protein